MGNSRVLNARGSTALAAVLASFAALPVHAGSVADAAAGDPKAAQAVDRGAHGMGQSPAEAMTSEDGGVEAIIVTARKQPEDIQRVPLSVSAVSGTALERRGIANLRELTAVVPSVAFVGQNSLRTSFLQIRGIGSSGLNPGIEPSVGVYFDGVYQKQATSVLGSSLLDLAAIEVLRGPQGTLYGRNTPVGAIVVRSRVPTQQFEAMVQGGAGNLESQSLQGYLGGGLGMDLAGRISFFVNHRDGYDLNLSDRSRINGQHEYGGRARLRWTPSSTFTADIIAFYTFLRGDCCVADNVDPLGRGGIATPGFMAAYQASTGRPYQNLTEKDHVVDTTENPIEQVKNFGAQFNGELDLGDGMTLTSITAYAGTRINVPRAASTSQPIIALIGSNATATDTFSEELRLASDTARTISYQAGVYLFHETTDYDESRTTDRPNRIFPDGTTLPSGLNYTFAFDQRTFSVSGYGQATWNMTDRLHLTGGGRYSHDSKKADISGVSTPGASPNFTASFPSYSLQNQKFSESKFTWLASLQYDLDQNVMVYGTASTGWKSGGFNGRPTPVGAPISFNAENARNYELGIKSRFFGQKLLVNLSLYHLRVKGFQDSTVNPQSGVGFVVGNIGATTAKGVEWDIQARPIPQLLLTASGAYLSAKFSDYRTAPCAAFTTPNGARPNTCDLSGRRPAFSPPWRFSVGGEFTQPIGSSGLAAFLRTDVSYNDWQYTYSTLDSRSIQDAYAIWSGRIGLQSGDSWRVSLWAKNLTNTRYWTATAALPNGGFLSNGGRTGVSTPLIGFTGAPRTYGIEASIKFGAR